ncbi:MAG: LpxI family protein [Deltaproteobacteria bacterium]|nr:LpxI family protein [Deltaproteobacteria bacterium]
MAVNLQEKKIGLIAGNGPFPVIFAKKATQKGWTVFANGYENETDPILADHVAVMQTIHIGQVKRLIRFFKDHGITGAVILGGIGKPSAFSDIKPDLKALSLLAGMRKNTGDDRVLRAFASLLENEGIRILPSTFLLPEILAPEGRWTKRKPSKTERLDIDLGWKIAKAVGRLDIGQCVVVGRGSVLAVEAIDGTDATILRGGALGKGVSVVVKVCKPTQDFRFDVPAVGVGTINRMHEAKITALCVEAGKTVVFERDEMIAAADRFGISIVAVKDKDGEKI